MERADTRDVAALLAATDAQGNLDPVAYEAQRLILYNQRGDALDAEGLMRGVHRSPLYQANERDKLIRAIDDRLDTPAEKRDFRQAMQESYLWSETKEGLGNAWSWAKREVNAADDAISGTLATGQLNARAASNDPNRGWASRLSAEAESKIIADIQNRYGKAKGAASDAAGMVTGTVDAARLAYRIGTDPAYRDAVLRVVEAYAADTGKDWAKPARDVYKAATGAIDKWNEGYKQAKQQGREQEYVGQTQGAAAVEIATLIVPLTKAAKLGKIGEAINLLGHAPIRTVEEATNVLEKVAALERQGGGAAKAATEITRSAVESARNEGKLLEFLEAAKKTDTVNGLLRSGVFTPKDLAEIARTDSGIFKKAAEGGAAGMTKGAKDGVTFQEAIDASTKGIDLKKLNSKQIGDIGEAVHTYKMASEGYTDIIAIKNKSGHGIDFVGRNKAGQLEFHEVKTSRVGDPAPQKGDPEAFVLRRLQRAIDADGHWAEKNTLPGLRETARKLQNEIRDTGSLKAKWVQISLEREPGSPALKVTPKVEDWTKPIEKHAELGRPVAAASSTIADARPLSLPSDMRDPVHPGYRAYDVALREVRNMEAACGIATGPHSERLAAGMAVATEQAKMGIDKVELCGDRAVALYRSGGINDPLQKTASILTDQALRASVEQHSAEWLKARSPYYAEAPAIERTPEQARLLSELSPKDQALFAKIRGNLPPQVNDDVAAHAALQAKRAGIDSPEKLAAVSLSGDNLYMQGTPPRRTEAVNLTQPVPSMQDTVQHIHTLNQQQSQQQLVQQLAQNQAGQNAPRAPVMG